MLIRYRKSHSQRSRILALDVMEFIRRFLQHVLPTGFMKIRYYGFMNPNCAVPLHRIRGLIELSYGFAVDLPVPEVEPPSSQHLPKLWRVAEVTLGAAAAQNSAPLRITRNSIQPDDRSQVCLCLLNEIRREAPRCAHVTDGVVPILSCCGEFEEKK